MAVVIDDASQWRLTLFFLNEAINMSCRLELYSTTCEYDLNVNVTWIRNNNINSRLRLTLKVQTM